MPRLLNNKKSVVAPDEGWTLAKGSDGLSVYLREDRQRQWIKTSMEVGFSLPEVSWFIQRSGGLLYSRWERRDGPDGVVYRYRPRRFLAMVRAAKIFDSLNVDTQVIEKGRAFKQIALQARSAQSQRLIGAVTIGLTEVESERTLIQLEGFIDSIPIKTWASNLLAVDELVFFLNNIRRLARR